MEENTAVAFQALCEYFSRQDIEDIPLHKQLELTKVAHKLGSICEQVDQKDQAEMVYRKGLEFMPFNVYILNILGTFMFRLGDIEGAEYYLRKAVQDNYYLPARKNLLHVMWHQIPRWHFRMMNDKKRNTYYQNAIANAIKNGQKNVYDIGTGCGLLSMVSYKNGAEIITGFEENLILFTLANQIFLENDVKVDLVFDSSVKFSQRKNKCNLIVSEIFDCGLFGEGCLDSLYHAITVFPENHHFKIIPSGARCYLIGLQCEKLRLNYYLTRNVPELNIDCNKIIVCSRFNSYDAQDVYNLIKNKEATIVTLPKLFHHFKFNSMGLNKMLLNNFVFHNRLTVIKDGILDVLVFYFDLKLDDENEITTNPLDDNRCQCWENAIFPIDEPLDIVKEEQIEICAMIENNQLKSFVNYEQNKPIFRVNREIVRYLNDKELCDFTTRVYNNNPIKNKNILDVNVMPFYGFLASKTNKVFSFYDNKDDLDFFDYLLYKNKVKLYFIDQKTADLNYIQDNIEYIYEDFVDIDGSWKGSFADDPKKIISINIQLHCQLIYSEYLDFCNKLDDNNVFNLKISKYLDAYKGDEHPNIENKSDFIKKSTEIIFDLNEDSFNFDGSVTIENSGRTNAILYWFTFNGIYSTLNSIYYSVAVKLLPNDLIVNVGDVLDIHVEKLFNHFIIKCTPPKAK